MKARIEYAKVLPKALKGMLELEKFVASSTLDHKLFELVKNQGITAEWLRLLPGHAHKGCPQSR